jgi:rhamnosyl/mannosyltransferase
MRVLHIGKFFPPVPGGIEYFLKDLAEELSKNIVSDVLCFNKGNQTTVEDRGSYLVTKIASLGTVYSAQITPSMVGHLKSVGPGYDVIHLQLPNPTATIAYLLSGLKNKLVLHWQSDIVRQRALMVLYKPFQDALLRRADAIVGTSQGYIAGSGDLAPYRRKCRVVPLGLSMERTQSSAPHKVNQVRSRYARDKAMIFSVGRLVYYKGFDHLIRAVKNTDTCLVIAGSGPLGGKLKKLASILGLEQQVFFAGNLSDSDLAAHYQAADIFCLPSVEKSEAFGVVQLEAMAYSKPLVSTSIPGSGVGWVNKNGETGFVVPPKDVKALRNALLTLVDDRALAENMGRAARERFEKKFDIRKIASQMKELYKTL